MPSKHGYYKFQNPVKRGRAPPLISSSAKVMKVFEEISSYTALTVLSPCRYFSNTIVQDSVMGAFLFHVMNFLSLFFFHLLCVCMHLYVCKGALGSQKRERERVGSGSPAP